MFTVTFPAAVGGDDSSYNDGSNVSMGGLAGYGYVTNLLPMLGQTVAVAAFTVTKAAEAAASAASALNAPGTSATSTTSMTVGTGSKAFTLAQTGKAYALGQSVVVASTASPGNQMNGIITAFNSGTGAMTVDVSAIVGSGTFASWTIALASLASSSLPSQTGQAGKFVTTNGTSASWGAALVPSNNLSDVANAATARANLGLATNPSFSAGVLVTGAAGTDRIFQLQTAGSTRWSLRADGVAESSTSTGSNFSLDRNNNSGAYIDTPFSINRTTGVASFLQPVSASITGTAANVTGTVAIANGGTGATSASAARTALGLGNMATQDPASVNITGGSISGLSSPLPLGSGGTGGATAGAARTALGAAASGANNDITSLLNMSTPLGTAKGGTGANFASLGAFLAGLPISGGAVGEFQLGTLHVKWGQTLFTGKTSGSAGEATVTFTTPFPSGVGGIFLQQVQSSGAEGGTAYVPYVKGYSTTAFTGGLDSLGTPDLTLSTFWFAFGF
jgi:hypothetical protein